MARSRRAPAWAALLGAAFLFLAVSCATPNSSSEFRARAESWAKARGFARGPLRVDAFDLFLLTRQSGPTETLVIYIEGDGAPWTSLFHAPRDPTPREPIALHLAGADPSPAVAYLGRPCQYLDAAALVSCDNAYWTGHRFAPAVVAAYDGAVTRLKARAGARQVRLIGYSGGGVIAALVASRRNDVERLITVAAPLALQEWVDWHGLTPLAGSLDPRERGAVGAAFPSVHFAGVHDATVPLPVIEGYVRSRGGRLETVAGFDHNCCWARDWPDLLKRAGRGTEHAR